MKVTHQFVNTFRFGLIGFLFLHLLLQSCNESTEVGSNLFDDEELNLTFVDDIPIFATTMPIDSVNVYPNFSPYTRQEITSFTLGVLDDPYFGAFTSGFIAQMHLTFDDFSNFVQPDYDENATIDSLVLRLVLDSTSFYGANSSVQDITVKRVTEDLSLLSTLNYNDPISTDEEVIGQQTRTVRFDSVSIFDPADDEFIMEEAQVRIRMSDAFTQEVFENGKTVETDSAFTSFLNGIAVESASTSNSTVGINIERGIRRSRLIMYYTDTIKKSYEYELANIAFNQYQNDFSTGIINDFVNDQSKGDDLIFVQSMLGQQVKIDLNMLAPRLDDVIINNVELIATVADLDDYDLNLYPPITQMLLFENDEDGAFVPIEEANEAILLSDAFAQNRIELALGGNLTEKEIDNVTLQQYTFNITRTIKDFVENDRDMTIYMRSFFENRSPGRSIMYGPKHAQFPLKLRVSYTTP